MNILFAVHQFFPQYYTGTERLVLNLSKQLQRMGHSVMVLTYGISETQGFKPEGDILIKNYEFQGVPVISIKHSTIPEEINFSIFDMSLEAPLKNVIINGNFDVVHVLHPMRVGIIARVAKQCNIPVILSPTDFWLMCPKGIAVTNKGELCKSSEGGNKCIKECFGNEWKDRLLNRFAETNEIFKMADCVVSATLFLKQVLETNNFTSDIKLIRFGEDYKNSKQNSKIYTENSELTIGFLSTLLRHKGAHVLLGAYNIAKIKNIKLKIYGHYFHEVGYYNTLIKMANNNERIEFYGGYNYEELPEIFSKIDILIVPSVWWENSPLIVLAALVNNIPVIVSNLGGLTEVIKDGVNGFVFEVGDAGSLAKVLQKIAQNPCIINDLKSGIQHPSRIEEMAFEYEKIYSFFYNQNIQLK